MKLNYKAAMVLVQHPRAISMGCAPQPVHLRPSREGAVYSVLFDKQNSLIKDFYSFPLLSNY